MDQPGPRRPGRLAWPNSPMYAAQHQSRRRRLPPAKLHRASQRPHRQPWRWATFSRRRPPLRSGHKRLAWPQPTKAAQPAPREPHRTQGRQVRQCSGASKQRRQRHRHRRQRLLAAARGRGAPNGRPSQLPQPKQGPLLHSPRIWYRGGMAAPKRWTKPPTLRGSLRSSLYRHPVAKTRRGPGLRRQRSGRRHHCQAQSARRHRG